jgi:hypothetical protein
MIVAACKRYNTSKEGSGISYYCAWYVGNGGNGELFERGLGE